MRIQQLKQGQLKTRKYLLSGVKMSEPRLLWASEAARLYEWQIAKNYFAEKFGDVLPDGEKFSRKSSGLTHSFIVVNQTIFSMAEKGKYIGKGLSGRVKIAEDEQGARVALKITRVQHPSELNIAQDLNVAIGGGSRQANLGDKHYIVYTYLGKTLSSYLSSHSLSQDQRYDLGIKMALELHRFHSGKQSKTGTSYVHRDLHTSNIVVDVEANPHLIDFEKSSDCDFGQEYQRNDVMQLLTILERYCPCPIFIPAPAKEKDEYAFYQRMKDSAFNYFFPPSKNRNRHAYALMIAEDLTVSRFGLEAYSEALEKLSQDARYEIIKMLNAQNTTIKDIQKIGVAEIEARLAAIGIKAPRDPQLRSVDVIHQPSMSSTALISQGGIADLVVTETKRVVTGDSSCSQEMKDIITKKGLDPTVARDSTHAWKLDHREAIAKNQTPPTLREILNSADYIMKSDAKRPTPTSENKSGLSDDDNLLTLQEQILEKLMAFNRHKEFIQACTKMMAMLVQLNNDHVLSSKDALHLMRKTGELIDNPKQYKDLLVDAKKYKGLADGKLSAYLMLIVGWAAKIVSFGLSGQTWIDHATTKLKQIETVEKLVSESEKRSNTP